MLVPVQGGGAMDPNSSFVVLHAVLSGYQGARSNTLMPGPCLGSGGSST